MSDNTKQPLPGSRIEGSPDKALQLADFSEDLADTALARDLGDDFRLSSQNPEAIARTERLRVAVREAGGNKAVAARAKVPLSTLGAYLGGRDWRIGTAVALAAACDVPLEWLATGSDRQAPAVETPRAAITEGRDASDPSHLFRDSYAVIPRYDVRASAGKGGLVEREELVGYLAFEESFVRQTLHRRRQDLVSIQAAGDSMEPNIIDGDLLIVDTSVQEVQSSRVYVLDINGELLVKRLSLRLDGTVVVRSDNPKYEPETVTPSERSSLRIIGQVVYQAGPVRS